MKQIDIKQTIIIAGVVCLIDAFLLNQGVLAVLAALIAFGVFLGKTIKSLFKETEPIKPRAIKLLIYVLMAGAVIGTNILNNEIARSRAEKLIQACQTYQAKYQKFPDRLEDLVPEFIPKIPLAKYTYSSNKFQYINYEGEKHVLYWVAFPPFGRPCYTLEEGLWGYWD